ncbi:MAG: hypothetical protein OEU74_01805 [Gammaproteobacteria bacterium]|nr:hypothetical protein [Gammaproteobacteria bacterium]
MKSLNWALVAVVMLAGIGCEGQSPQDERPGVAQSENNFGSQPLTLDYGAKKAIDGYRRFEGACPTFPYNLQYPADWEVQASRGVSISKTRSNDTRFIVSIRQDHGADHAGRFETTMLGQGAEEAGHIEVGGHKVRVLSKGERYILHTPHGPGALFHQLDATSSLGAEETLKILDTLEPLEDC